MLYSETEVFRCREGRGRKVKVLKRRRIRHKKKMATSKGDGVKINHSLLKGYRVISKRHYSSLIKLFASKGYLSDEGAKRTIVVPKKLSFVDSFDNTVGFLKMYLSSLYLYPYNLTLDFRKCQKLDLAPVFLMKIFWIDFVDFKVRFNRAYYSKLPKALKLFKSYNGEVNRMLFAFGFVGEKDNDDEFVFLPMEMKYGEKSRKLYGENAKGRVCSDVREFVNNSLKGVNFKLNVSGINKLDKLISEILNNAEDHSLVNRWYVDGISFKDKKHEGKIVELNLSIANFGYSIFEGIEQSREENYKVYQRLSGYYEGHLKLIQKPFAPKFSKEELFTLYALQEGESRLKYKDESRGNGTMHFLEAFINLGAVGDERPEFKPKLNIFSGNVSLFCDNHYKPYLKDNIKFLSLNKEKDFCLLPDPNYLKSFTESFPGTVFQIKIFLSESYIMKLKDQKNGESQN